MMRKTKEMVGARDGRWEQKGAFFAKQKVMSLIVRASQMIYSKWKDSNVISRKFCHQVEAVHMVESQPLNFIRTASRSCTCMRVLVFTDPGGLEAVRIEQKTMSKASLVRLKEVGLERVIETATGHLFAAEGIRSEGSNSMSA